MRHLPEPLPDISPEQIYKECVDGFESEDFKNRLADCTELVKEAASDFKQKIPAEISELTMPELPQNVTKDDLVKVYDQKFVSKKGPGRKYYNSILSRPFRNICPICEIRIVSNLDHYLPKSKYPLLVVTPLNLIPSCRDCNFEKHTYEITTEAEAPLNPYFDDISCDQWLSVRINSDQSVLYYVDAPAYWTDVLTKRVKNHIEIYKLQELYGSHAIQDINDSIQLWRNMYMNGSHTELLHYLCDIKESAEHNELNSWKAALYRGLVNQIDIVETWL